jgi:hypothetical protein
LHVSVQVVSMRSNFFFGVLMKAQLAILCMCAQCDKGKRSARTLCQQQQPARLVQPQAPRPPTHVACMQAPESALRAWGCERVGAPPLATGVTGLRRTQTLRDLRATPTRATRIREESVRPQEVQERRQHCHSRRRCCHWLGTEMPSTRAHGAVPVQPLEERGRRRWRHEMQRAPSVSLRPTAMLHRASRGTPAKQTLAQQPPVAQHHHHCQQRYCCRSSLRCPLRAARRSGATRSCEAPESRADAVAEQCTTRAQGGVRPGRRVQRGQTPKGSI